MRNQEWQIKSRSDRCVDCERPFEQDEAFVSRLRFGPEGYAREDSCLACDRQRSAPEGLVSAWRGVYKKPPPPKPEAVRRETAETLLRTLIEEEDPAHLNTIYILAVMLERRRLFVEKEVYRNDERAIIRVYEHKKTGEAFLIRDPELKLAALEHVQAEVIERLGLGEKSAAKQEETVAAAS